MLKRYLRRFNPRSWSNDELRLVLSHCQKKSRVVNVSGWQDRDKEGGCYKDYFPSPTLYHISNYEGDAARGAVAETDLVIDLTKPLSIAHEYQYDIVFNHTVLEHVEEPTFAFSQIGKLTTDMIVTVVPFKQKLHFEHGMFGDYYRFTPFSMRRLHAENGFSVLYESYTPRPSLDVYLLYVGVRDVARHVDFPQRLADLRALNQRVGSFSAKDLALNIGARFFGKYFM